MRLFLVLLVASIGWTCFGQFVPNRRLNFQPVAGGGGGLTLGTVDNQATAAGTTTVHTYTGLAANTFLVITAANENAAPTVTFTVADNTGLTWTRRVQGAGTGNPGSREIYTAMFAAGGNITITVTCSSSAQNRSSTCYPFTGTETSWGGATADSPAAQALPSLAITTTRAGSYIVVVTCDFASKSGARTYRSPPTMTEAQAPQNANYCAYHYYGLATTATAYTVGLTTPTAEQAGTSAIEIRAP